MEPITEEVLPVEASMSGKNAFYIPCAMLGSRPNYGLCLFTIKSFKEGRLSKSSPCRDHIARGNCDALALQAQEQEAGRALFFQQRPETKAASEPTKVTRTVTGPASPGDSSYMRGWNAPAAGKTRPEPSASKPKPKAKPKKSKIFGTETASLADAVNEATKEEAIKNPGAFKGMSLLERARAMKQLKAEQQ